MQHLLYIVSPVFSPPDIAVHHYRYRWTAFKMSDETRQGTRKRYYTCSEIQDSIETIFCRKKRLVV